jgi:predicted nucleic acid-binding protein
MNRFLPDVNTLLALLDPMHVHHEAAHQWYASQSPMQIVLCSHVENGVIRVASQPKYPNYLGTGARVREALGNFARQLKTRSCDREVSLLNDGVLVKPELLTPSSVTDLYLLALASVNGIRLATFDQKIPAHAIAGGVDALEIIGFKLP